MEKALLIEDDNEIVELLTTEVDQLGYVLEHATDGQSGLTLALQNEYAFLLLDMQLPGLGGSEICKRVRKERDDLPIIVLTSKSDEASKVLLLELGADDYVTKPFSAAELRARINAVLRRSNRRSRPSEELPETLIFGAIQIDTTKHRVTREGEAVELTASEYDILLQLAMHPGKPFGREEINEGILGYPAAINSKNVSNHINRLRNKLEPNPDQPIYILTVRGVGYCFSDQLEDEPQE